MTYVVTDSNQGSIPACAGEPFKATEGTTVLWVYPRVCGGTDNYWIVTAQDQGLSPRVRGNHGIEDHTEGLRWSIPACAGEPVGETRRTSLMSVYPRVCGGTMVTGALTGSFKGLSPRVRGNPTRCC